ncbi:putative disease resistance protein At4g19050 isoform X2 [Diospyros lotus]|nr:putative disease resistance protein At4g19050 isoform X2 [Diospyros lotus]
MATTIVVQNKWKVFQLLKDDKVRRIVLYGEAGVGKTWIARQMANLARKRGLIDIALWIFLCREYDIDALRDSIAYQLSVLITGKPRFEYDTKKSDENQGDLLHKISTTLAGKKLLLVLDDEGKKMNEQQIIEKLETLLNLGALNYKILITKRDNPSSSIREDSERSAIMVNPLSKDESLSLLQERAAPGVYEDPGIRDLAENFIEKTTKNLPAAVILMAKAFNYFARQDYRVRKLEHSLEQTPINKVYDITQLLCSGYDLVPNNILIDCWHSHFFKDHNRIHYNELIAYWMMEGYLGCINSMEKAHEKGYEVLMELIDCQILREVEVDYVMMEERTTLNLDDVVMERTTTNSDDCYRRGFGGTANLGLANVYGNGKWEGLGKLILKDGAMETLNNGKKQKLSTILLDGNSLNREFPSNFFQSQEGPKVISLFNPTLDKLSFSSVMKNLYVLLLRCCHYLEKIDQVHHSLKYEKLTVLEISGPSSLTMLPDDIFKHMPQLRSVNLSRLQVDKLPSSLYELSELTWLILRECSCLTTLKSLKSCTKLTVLDLSGAKSLSTIEEGRFLGYHDLQLLNLSETKVTKIPLINGLKNLTHLLLRGCLELKHLGFIYNTTSLQVLDISDSSKINEILDESLELIKDLKIMDLSGTAVEVLRNIGNPHHLYLKRCSKLYNLQCVETLKDLETLDISNAEVSTLPEFSHLCNLRHLSMTSCLNLKEFPDLNPLKNLEVLDLSGCISLTKLPDNSFERMSRLLRLDLSGTKIVVVPDLSKLCNLRHLLLKNCSDLSDVPQLGSLTKLVELNLRGIRSLKRADFVEHMNQLQILDLSGTQLEQLPSRSRLGNLTELYLRGCPCLKEVSDLNSLKNMKNQGASSSNIEEPNHCAWGISVLPVAIVDGNDKPSASFNGSQFQQLLKEDPSLWQKDYEQFHFVVHPIEVQDRKVIVSLWRDDFVFKDTYLRTKYLYDFQMLRSTEIHGFHHFPEGLEDVLCHTDSVFLVDNVLESLLSNLRALNLEQLKGCWIERCREMESVFCEQEEGEIMKLKNLEVLWVSSSGNLKHIYRGNWQTGTFQNLKHLYLDCCPKLSTIFSSPQVPTNLQVLHIKFCDELEAVLEQESAESKFPNLVTLYLWELPKLKTIGCPLPSWTTEIIWACPKLERFRENVN